ncbi:Flagellar basal body rod FlgEFG protein C-terminal [Tistlia consotensis]|uniref:Flagellar basal body rod FlgEFG protein C-terminal n=1 Tax=Tistlia consotensis USBA 355 TaxID=560819 RepID=A0A1Y6CBC3_9PROT|nr:flagellar basal body rod C-terminal domain-containing protein [Tistlia consotensis]SMF46802.1 Flagellar basal body rod FlgEFG protein C-terminal [Tistlia consotensis USBA 355]SNR78025.1 Flagellar basal body rod FlgEFG protein C-terminal [Tistlia consotensis]
MTPALTTAQNGLSTASKRFGAAATALVAVSAAETQVADAQTAQAVQSAAGGQGGASAGNQNGLAGQGAAPGQLPLPEGLLPLLQEAGVSQAKGRFGTVPSLEESTVDMLQAQRAFEANLRVFQAADRQLGDTLNLIA